jgi:tetratricopeptide (TPR) repeat protein
VETAVRSALVIVIGLLATACASAPAPRPLARGFGVEGGVADPYADGKRHLAEGNNQLAAQRFGQALADDGRSLDALNGLAIAYTRLGRFDSAETQLERALQIEPTDAATLNNYGWSLIEQGRLREARAFLELARVHETAAEAPTIATNFEKLQQAQPPALLGALAEGSAPQAPRGLHRLIRLADNAYLLERTDEPAEPSALPSLSPEVPLTSTAVRAETAASGSSENPAGPDAPFYVSTPAQDAGPADALQGPAQQSRAAPEPDVRMRPRTGGDPIRLFPPLAPGADAGPITTGDAQ